MKKLMFVLTFLVASTAIVTAQDSTGTQAGQDQYRTDPTAQDPTTGQEQPMGKETITASELPQPVTDQLEGQNYSGWTIEEASRRMKGDETIYEVELTSGDEVKKLKLDDQGNVLKEKTKRKKN